LLILCVLSVVVLEKNSINSCCPDFYHVQYEVDSGINCEEALLAYPWKLWAAQDRFYMVSRHVILIASGIRKSVV